jgi:L-fuculose-phosphate aldolase
MEGFPVGGGKPSSELKLHLQCYASRPDCHAVIHAHPLTATAFTLVGETIPDDLMPEAAYVLGPVVNVPFAMPTTEEVPKAVKPYLATHKTLLLSHHGAVVIGTNLSDAYNRMETLERIAKIVFMARCLGNPLPMPADTFAAIKLVALNGNL